MKLTLTPQSLSADPASTDVNLKLWEDRVGRISSIQKITPENQAYFSSLLSRENDIDSYLTSPVYYALTGRKGLWVYSEGEAFVPFCWHPNIVSQILIFPARGKPQTAIVENLIDKLPEPSAGIKLARVKTDEEQLGTDSSQDLIYAPVIEQTLDWKYPVRILSTKLVAAMAGPDFRYIRNHVKHVAQMGATCAKITGDNRAKVEAFIQNRSQQFSASYPEQSDFAELYSALVSFIGKPNSKVSGFAVEIDGKVEALSIWDVSNVNVRTANRYANLANTKIRGLADFATHQSAILLRSEGIGFLNIGGAETVSLDNYKKKFMPVHSVALHSVEVVTSTDHDLLARPPFIESGSRHLMIAGTNPR